MKKSWIAFAVICSASLLSACSTELMYDLAQSADRDNCRKLSDPPRSNCLDQKRESYDQYKQKRDDLVNGPKRTAN